VTILATIRKYTQVTKPGIILGNMVSTAGGFLLASRGHIAFGLLLATITAVSLVVASGCVFNNCIDRDIDCKMTRTNNRVLARGLMSFNIALIYASLLGISGAALLLTTTNVLCVSIVLAGFTIYTGIYSLYLKRRSVHATLIGSLAGAAPPLAGYCAVTNHFDLGALILVAIFILWQVPHSYTLVIYRVDDYTAAAIPASPIKQGIPAAKKHIVGYIVAFMGVSSLLTLGGYTGYWYLAVAETMGLIWLFMACSGTKASDDDPVWAKKLFIFSIIIITTLNIMMAVDATI